jgi:hypothetical protein
MRFGKGGNGGFAGQALASKLLSKPAVKGQIRQNCAVERLWQIVDPTASETRCW